MWLAVFHCWLLQISFFHSTSCSGQESGLLQTPALQMKMGIQSIEFLE